MSKKWVKFVFLMIILQTCAYATKLRNVPPQTQRDMEKFLAQVQEHPFSIDKWLRIKEENVKHFIEEKLNVRVEKITPPIGLNGLKNDGEYTVTFNHKGVPLRASFSTHLGKDHFSVKVHKVEGRLRNVKTQPSNHQPIKAKKR